MLAIETSCDETAAAVVEETGDPARPWRLRASVVASQFDIHREWGGIVPELSARQHVRDICGVVERALADAAAPYDAVAVTQGPGLRSEEHTSELQSQSNLVCRLLLEQKNRLGASAY